MIPRARNGRCTGPAAPGTLVPPVVGSFINGRGEFYGDDTYNGKDIRARFIWSDITADSAHWKQAFSVDQEQTWLTNWIMEITRSPEQSHARSLTRSGRTCRRGC